MTQLSTLLDQIDSGTMLLPEFSVDTCGTGTRYVD